MHMRFTNMIRGFGLALGLAAAASTISIVPAQAQDDVARFGARIGFLNCQVAAGWGLIFGSSRTINCVFSGLGGQVIESYSGRITNFGIDVGYRTNGVMLWGVFAPTDNVEGEGVLSGTYVGIGAQAALGVGFGGRILIGGGDNNIALQPFSIEGVAGINIAAGIASLRLEPDALPLP
jgi:hypothetical protein